MCCRDVLRFMAEVRHQPRIYDLSARFADRLESDLSRRVSQLSTGMKRKLALAGTLAADTALVILDEPTANLDPAMRVEVLSMVREVRDGGRTVIFSSHLLSDVEESCDRVVLLRKGTVVHSQVLGELRQQHRDSRDAHRSDAAAASGIGRSIGDHRGPAQSGRRSKRRASYRAYWVGWPLCRWPRCGSSRLACRRFTIVSIRRMPHEPSALEKSLGRSAADAALLCRVDVRLPDSFRVAHEPSRFAIHPICLAAHAGVLEAAAAGIGRERVDVRRPRRDWIRSSGGGVWHRVLGRCADPTR